MNPEYEFEWTPGIGDPTVLGWLTVAAYFAAAYLCLRAFKAQKKTPDRRSGLSAYLDAASSLARAFRKEGFHFRRVPPAARRAAWWLALGVLFLLLGVNKQLDLQSMFTEIGRWLAHHQGWYEQRNEVQLLFVAAVGLVGGLALIFMMWLAGDQLAHVGLATLGAALVVVFVFARASSMHEVDAFINTRILSVRLNSILELSSIALVAVAAARHARLSR